VENPTLFASTLPKPHKQPLQPKLCQRACKADPKEKEILKNAQPHDKNTNESKQNRT
jgi:hypothetical protein